MSASPATEPIVSARPDEPSVASPAPAARRLAGERRGQQFLSRYVLPVLVVIFALASWDAAVRLSGTHAS